MDKIRPALLISSPWLSRKRIAVISFLCKKGAFSAAASVNIGNYQLKPKLKMTETAFVSAYN